jgi:hypothetical protein
LHRLLGHFSQVELEVLVPLFTVAAVVAAVAVITVVAADVQQHSRIPVDQVAVVDHLG